MSERGDNYCSGQLASSVLSRGKESPLGEFTHYRRHTHTHTHTHTQTQVQLDLRGQKKLGVAGLHAELVMEIRSLLHAQPPSNCLGVFVFRRRQEQR